MNQRAREILKRYREAESLGPLRRARVLGAVQQRLASGETPGEPRAGKSGAPSGADPKLVAKALARIAPKIVVGALVAAVPAAWMWHGVSGPPRSFPPSVAGPATRDNVGPTSLRPQSASPLPAAEGTLEAPPLLEHPLSPRVRRQVEPTHRPPALRSGPSSAPAQPGEEIRPYPEAAGGAQKEATATSLGPAAQDGTGVKSAARDAVDEEVRLLALAYSDLRAGHPSRALAMLSEHERRFPNGPLTESRRAARILALCDLGLESAARAESTQFLATYPASPFSNRVRDACSDRHATDAPSP